ncbi:hypothetical protein JTE90_016032 [Oedothorax gibbosus]|uniref:Uncharacterized protein n=1 Tax=Oedothorax gibbosus TaxID=931172 RepID=A0AAV6VSI4_9ARAC|nr:hypothetical protein JTE90_016032 [Oedothorax gibbosus]
MRPRCAHPKWTRAHHSLLTANADSKLKIYELNYSGFLAALSDDCEKFPQKMTLKFLGTGCFGHMRFSGMARYLLTKTNVVKFLFDENNTAVSCLCQWRAHRVREVRV